MATDQFYDVTSSTFSSWTDGTLGALQDNGTKLRLNGTTNWKSLGGGDGGANAIDTDDRNVAYYGHNILSAGGGPGPIYRTSTALASGQNTGTTDPTIGVASHLWSDPYRRGVLLGNGADGQLYYAPDAGKVTGNIDHEASWTCIDPTPNDSFDFVTSVDFPGQSGVYFVTTLIPTAGEFRQGGIYKVVVKNPKPPVVSCSNPLSRQDLEVTTIISPDKHLGEARISIDPERPDTALYATFENLGSARVQHIVFDSSTGQWNPIPIAGGFPSFGTAGNYWNAQTFPSYPIAADPTAIGSLYVGTENGLAVGTRNGSDDSSWSWKIHPYFPMTEISDLHVSRGPVLSHGIVRASTIGRSVWERAACPILMPPIPIEPNVHVPVPPPVNPLDRTSSLVLPVEYALPAGFSGEARVQATMLEKGVPSSRFVIPPVPIRAGRGTVFVDVFYGRSNAPLGMETDGLIVQIESAAGQVLAEEKIPGSRAWRRPSARSLYVRAEVESDDGAPNPVPVPLRALHGKRRLRIVGGSSIPLPVDSILAIEAPRAIETTKGTAHFEQWLAILDEQAPASETLPRRVLTKPDRRVVELRVIGNLVVTARYRLQELKYDKK